MPQDFEGPLDVILYLLSRNKIEIQDIPIALILEQYIDYLEQRKRFDLEIASEFTAMAARLMYLKTRMLLTYGAEETQEDVDLLIQSLEEHKRKERFACYRAVAALLSDGAEYGGGVIVRQPEAPGFETVREYSHTGNDLLLALRGIGERLERAAEDVTVAFSNIATRESYPVAEKEEQIMQLLEKDSTLSLGRLFQQSRSRGELVAIFLAVLELCRSCKISVDADGPPYVLRPYAEEATLTAREKEAKK